MIHNEHKDPIDERAKAGKNGRTFEQHFDYMDKLEPRFGWRSMLEIHAFPVIGHKHPTAVTKEDIIEIIAGLTKAGKFETRRKVQQRLQAILKSATGNRDTVAHKDYICDTLPSFKKVQENTPYSSIDFADMPAFFRELRDVVTYHDGIEARALEFLILTVCRTGDIIGQRGSKYYKRNQPAKLPIRWTDIDEKRRVWIVPAVKTADAQNPKPFEIPLSDAAWAVIERVKAMKLQSHFVFPRKCGKLPIERRAMYELLRDLRPGSTVHGMRTAFRTYAGEKLDFEDVVIETAMAHKVFSKDKHTGRTDKGKKPYMDKTQYLEKRTPLMQQWGQFVTGKNVVPFKRKAA
jgi:integrase